MTSTEKYRVDPEYRAKCIARMKAYHLKFKEKHGKSRSTVIYQQHPEYRVRLAERARERAYGVTPEHYQAMLDHQNSKCAVCGGVDKPTDRRAILSVDHDHKTGEVRGLLCRRCNSVLGYVNDDMALLQKMAEYLKCQR